MQEEFQRQPAEMTAHPASGPAGRTTATWSECARLAAWPLLLLMLASAAVPASAAERGAGTAAESTCPQAPALVAGATATDLADVCRGVQSALAFFASHGIQATESLSIEVTDKLPPEAGPSAAGCYIAQKRRVYVVPYDAFRKNKTWFGVAIDRSLYRALAAHEAAHAVAGCSFRIPNPTIQAQEYLAYAAMFSTMAPALRDKALRATRTQGFDDIERFTPMLYMFDPMRFGAEAWRHFSKAPDQAAVLRAVLEGRQLSDR